MDNKKGEKVILSMVHKKYIKRGGKTFGPYYYKTYRQGSKVKTTYLGRNYSPPKKNSKTTTTLINNSKESYPTIHPNLFFTILIILIISSLVIPNFTGKTVSIKEDLELNLPSIVPSKDPEYDFQAITGQYQIYFKNDLRSNTVIKLTTNQKELFISPKSIKYSDSDNNQQPISNFNPLSEASIFNNQLTYKNAFGEGIDLIYELKDNSIISSTKFSEDSLFIPDTKILNNNPQFEVDYLISYDSKVYYDQRLWEENFEVLVTDILEFKESRNNLENLFVINLPTIKDTSVISNLFLQKSGSSIFLSTKTPYSEIKTNKQSQLYFSIDFAKKEKEQTPLIKGNEEYTANSRLICNGNICNQQLSLNKIALENEQGEFRPFEETVKISKRDDLFIIKWKDKSVTFAPFLIYKGKEYVQRSYGIYSPVSRIPSEINVNNKFKDSSHAYKYDLGFYNLRNFKSEIDQVGLKIESVTGFSKEDITIDENSIILPDGIEFSWQDAIDAGFFLDISKDKITIKNADNQDFLLIDPVIGLGAGEDVDSDANPPPACCGTEVTRKAWLKFPIKDIPSSAVNITSAELVLQATFAATDGVNISIYNVTNQTWQEANNDIPLFDALMASPTSTVGNSTYVTSTGFYFWNITEVVRDAFALGTENLTLRLNSTNYGLDNRVFESSGIIVGTANMDPDDFIATFYAREDSQSTPLLNITYTLETVPSLIYLIDPTPINNTNTSSNSLLINTTIFDTNPSNLTFILVNSTAEINRTNVSTATSGNYSLIFTSLADDIYYYNVTSIDLAGNKNFTETRTITIDNSVPIITYISSTPENASIQSSTTLYINVTVTDSLLPISSCIVFQTNLNGPEPIQYNHTMTKTGTGTNVTCNYTFTGLSENIYTYKVLSNDTLGNFNETNLRQVTIDTSLPLVYFNNPTPINNTYTSSNSLLINTTIFDLIPSNLTFILVNSTAEINRTNVSTANPGNYSLNFTSLISDIYYYNVTGIDQIGNKNFTETRTITIDTVNPLINLATDSFDNATTYNISYIILNVTLTENNFANLTFILSNLTAEINRTTINSQTATRLNFTSLSSTNYTFNVTITDLAGNKNFTETREVYLITPDTLPPVIEFISQTPSDASSQTSTTVYINTTIYDNNLVNNINSCTLTWQGSNYSMTKTGTGTNVTCNYTFTGLSVATYTYKVLSNDTLSNFNQTSQRTVVISSSGGGGGNNGGGGKKICTSGDRRCSTDELSIQECSSNGKKWELVEECSLNHLCELVSGEPACVCQADLDIGTWSQCINGFQNRTISDNNNCVEPRFEIQKCDSKEDQKCPSDWQCGEWGQCEIDFNLEKILSDNLTAIGKQSRVCSDLNSCKSDKLEQRSCQTVAVKYKTQEWCGAKHNIVLDAETGEEVARLRPVIVGGVPRVDLEIGENLQSLEDNEFCWYCSNGIKDFDEEGIDCGGPSCSACGFEVKLTKDDSKFIWWYIPLIVFLVLIVLTLLLLEIKNQLRKYVLTKMKSIDSLIDQKLFDKSMDEFRNLKHKVNIPRWFSKDKKIIHLHNKIARSLLLYKAKILDKLGMTGPAKEAREKAKKLKVTANFKYLDNNI